MPTYEYSCTACGEPLEIVQSIHDDSLTECPKCGGKLRKLFGNVGVVFKGSGFYKNDSRDAKKGKPKPAAAKSSTSTDSTESSSKTAPASESKSSDSASSSASTSTTSAPKPGTGSKDS